jgi:chromosome segregation ATPase
MIMVYIPLWILVVILIGVATVSGVVFWVMGRFLFRKGGDTLVQEESQEDPIETSHDRIPVLQELTSRKEDRMATPAEIKKELERAAQNLTKVTTALRNERAGRAEDKRTSDETISAKDQEIADMKEQIRKLTGEKDAQGSAVTQGAASLADANREAEEALASS